MLISIYDDPHGVTFHVLSLGENIIFVYVCLQVFQRKFPTDVRLICPAMMEVFDFYKSNF